ncbi:unnamed protein product [Pleuronectes platessa]|uniref:Uncharacterized protein n=1 Tax=Pleuronectes platessa TaxID=8262 RepID=A0A9N7U1S3_PLEPL|nr:unnamed protein product [Pleuronectes platessa]
MKYAEGGGNLKMMSKVESMWRIQGTSQRGEGERDVLFSELHVSVHFSWWRLARSLSSSSSVLSCSLVVDLTSFSGTSEDLDLTA